LGTIRRSEAVEGFRKRIGLPALLTSRQARIPTPTVTQVGGAGATGNPYLFQSRRWCTETNLYYFRNRDLFPTLGRFLQRDPIGYADGMSLYEGVKSTPTVFRDPYGEAVITVALTTYCLGKVVFHSILGRVYLKHCLECLSRAQELITMASKQLPPEKVAPWLRTVKPGNDCAEFCYNGGKHSFKAVVYLMCKVVIRYSLIFQKY